MTKYKFCDMTASGLSKFQLGDKQFEKARENGMKFFKFYSDKKTYIEKLNSNKILMLIHKCMINEYDLSDVLVEFHTAMKMERCNYIIDKYDIEDFYESMGYLVVYYYVIHIKHNQKHVDDCMIDIFEECYNAVGKVFPIFFEKFNIKI